MLHGFEGLKAPLSFRIGHPSVVKYGDPDHEVRRSSPQMYLLINGILS